ncbi:hypothetical protein UB46_30190 [Burkholderiaceae bacterium 16]|nr:hypothetical protein UB46_30190 [Burkholderiaceae bacterium 16]
MEPFATLHQPIGVFDSGIGSYAAVRLLQGRFPDQDLIYLADRASFPYGGKDRQALLDVTAQAVRRLQGLGASAILMASNAPSVTVLDDLRRAAGVPLFGVVPPVAEALALSKSRQIGVLGVRSMVGSTELGEYIATASRGRGRASSFNASALVELVESGDFLTDPARTGAEVDAFLGAILAAQPEIDVFTLSSTHLPWLDDYFQRLFPGKTFVDPVRASVEALAPLTTAGTGRIVCAATESPVHTVSAFHLMLAAMGIELDVVVIGEERL